MTSREFINGVLIFPVVDDDSVEVMTVARCLGCDDFEEFPVGRAISRRHRRANEWAVRHLCTLGTWRRLATRLRPSHVVDPSSVAPYAGRAE